MVTKTGRLVLTVLIVCIFGMLPAAAQHYRLASGDVLEISVWGHEDLQIKEIAVRPDGKIAFPLVGELPAGGLSPAELSQTITDSLSNYINNPVVTVNIFKYRTTRVYVLGEVAKPGMYELEKQHNLLDAIGMAGSYTKYAAKKKVYVIRGDKEDINTNTNTKVKVNLLNLLEKGDMSQNVVLNDGDIVFLSKSGKIDLARDILPWISATYQVTEIQNN
ncbi:polysaccharide biosynthesis/export family protein [Sporomusa sphaeroides]|uniref:polysaccharide biosynthesis/export family protein n=1 Tax=Sporomusa sphaeroides TaxID=47679 RepID=UPI002C6CF2A0|nr:polysaccharide biosynthesis/export family protein [Sporomusa sphaeroides]HML34160.1 polysaccharide biosynthesis/export family protein [Sporomusa sphaeroides]